MKRLAMVFAIVSLLGAGCGFAGDSGPAPSTGSVEEIVRPSPDIPGELPDASPPTTAPAPLEHAPSQGPTGPGTVRRPEASDYGPPPTTVPPPSPTSPAEPPRWEQIDIGLPDDAPEMLRRVSGVAAADVLNVRAEPGPGSTLIGKLAPGVTVCLAGGLTEYGSSTWYQIHSPAGLGWVHGGYLQPLPGATPPGFVGGIDPIHSDGDGTAFFTGVRLARHDGFDRLVIDLEPRPDSGGMPGYSVWYSEPPFFGVPGDVVPVAGRAFIGVSIEGATMWDWESQRKTYGGPWRVEGATTTITEVVITEDFEDWMFLVVGLNDHVPFDAYVLDDPLRLVVDVARSSADPVTAGSVSGDGTGYGWPVDSRLAPGDGFDRFVVEFSPDYEPPWAADVPEYRAGVPSWVAGWSAPPFTGCQEEPVVAGGEFLSVSMPGAAFHGPGENPVVLYQGPYRLTAATGNVVEVVLMDNCQGASAVIGVDHGAAFKVTELDGPPRLVIDVEH